MNSVPMMRELVLQPSDNIRLVELCGPLDQHLHQIEATLGVEVKRRGNRFQLIGSPAAIKDAEAVLQGLYTRAQREPVDSERVHIALQELGMIVVGTSVRKSTDGDKERIRTLMGGEERMIENIPPREMYARLKGGEADILVSGSRTQFVALKAKVPWLDINQERHVAYAGYDGIVTLVRELYRALTNPVWDAVRRPAPWESAAMAVAAE